MGKARHKLLTKEGLHGTLYRYVIKYTDDADPGCPEFSWPCWAYSSEHAREKFAEGEDAHGWKILKVSRKTDGPELRRAG